MKMNPDCSKLVCRKKKLSIIWDLCQCDFEFIFPNISRCVEPMNELYYMTKKCAYPTKIDLEELKTSLFGDESKELFFVYFVMCIRYIF